MAENDQQQQQNGDHQQQQQQQQQAKPWHDGIDAETRGHWDNKGFKYEDPKALATELTKAWKGLERHFGAPADQIVRLPKDATDEAGWKAVRQRLGMPAEPKDYDFTAVGKEIDPALADTMRAALHKAGVAKDAAPEVVKAVLGFQDGKEAAAAAERTARSKTDRDALAKEWGTNFEFNRLTAMQGARRAVGTDEAAQKIVAAMEDAVGYKATMEFWRKIGAGTSEDTFHDARHLNGMPTTRAGAVARRSELMADKGWTGRYLAGDLAAKQEMNNLLQIISGDAA